MAEIVNLRMARKAARRAGKEAEAAQNRARFGQSKGATAQAKAERDGIARTLDGARLDRD
ncbi:DUF4169 domain-containing protein [Altererythrobacter sp. B11]|uniref:DUF4169 family protein n=1 Tax=Altererythrobacter sp. B11 TaxID=2060312 RepID=UPI000DC70891|nr:DUF4169 family protein [Altererythrobacter sp. B11]BBC72601.1 DUF4169 domain-containing protein [Altererythrobacter sp. B11]